MSGTIIRASCPDCGTVELGPADLALNVSSDPSLSHYAFTCPSCAARVRKPADDQVISLLTAGGVPARPWEPPAEASEAKTGPALTYDDLLDFALALGSTDLLAEAATIPANG